MKTYLDHAQRNPEAAITLHLWNSRISKALRFPLETVELTVRNRTHYALADRWGDFWPRTSGFLAAAAQKTANAVDAAYGEVGPHAITDRVVSELSFGFWPPLFKGRFVEELWKERFDDFFPYFPEGQDVAGKVAQVARLLDDARNLRNRISHLEPVFKMNLSVEHANLLKLVSYACRDTASWMRKHSTLNAVMRDGPSAVIVEPIPFKKANKTLTHIGLDRPLAEAWGALADGSREYLIAAASDGPRVLGHAEIGIWVRSKAGDGIIDIETTPIGEVLSTVPPTPVVKRKVSVSELRALVGRRRSRFAVVTESGDPAQAPLGVIDLFDLIA
jgi:hypothetical protein